MSEPSRINLHYGTVEDKPYCTVLVGGRRVYGSYDYRDAQLFAAELELKEPRTCPHCGGEL